MSDGAELLWLRRRLLRPVLMQMFQELGNAWKGEFFPGEFELYLKAAEQFVAELRAIFVADDELWSRLDLVLEKLGERSRAGDWRGVSVGLGLACDEEWS